MITTASDNRMAYIPVYTWNDPESNPLTQVLKSVDGHATRESCIEKMLDVVADEYWTDNTHPGRPDTGNEDELKTILADAQAALNTGNSFSRGLREYDIIEAVVPAE